MQTITTIGLDIAKSIFQVHGVDAEGNVVVRRQLKRRYVLTFLSEVATMPGWHRGRCIVASLVARTSVARSHGPLDATRLCQAICQKMLTYSFFD
jgi:transposase